MIKISLLLVAFLVALTNGNAIPNADLSVVGDYVPRGQVINIGNLPVYEVPDNVNSGRMLIHIHDIFGFSSPNLRQVADLMALQQGGFRVVLPDFFRGESWDRNIPVDPNNTPPALQALLDRVGNWELNVRQDLINVVRHYQSQGVQEFAIYGNCWGGRIATLAASELYMEFRASAFITPLHMTNALAPAVRIPLFLVPSRDEPDLLPFYQVIRNNFGDYTGHLRFDAPHGFASTIGNFNDPIIQNNVNEVITSLGVFFARILQH